MPEKKTAFYAYPGTPTEIAQTIQSAIVGFNTASPAFNLEGWEKNDISGIPLTAPKGRYCGDAQAEAIALKGLDIMDTQTLLIIIVLVLLLGGGGWYGRGRWF